MPVIQIHALAPPETEQIDLCLAAATEALAGAIQCAPSAVWAQYLTAEAMHTGTRPRRFAGHCPVVVVRAMPGRTDAQIRSGLTGVATAVAAALDLAVEDIWAEWHTLTPGHVFAGGGIRQ